MKELKINNSSVFARSDCVNPIRMKAAFFKFIAAISCSGIVIPVGYSLVSKKAQSSLPYIKRINAGRMFIRIAPNRFALNNSPETVDEGGAL